MKIRELLSETQLDDVTEGHYRRPGSPTAYDRDYASSVSGMGHKQSQAYQQDGGANDEGWDREPRQRYQAPEDKPVLKGYYFYDVPAGMEGEAAIYGVKKTKNGKWAKALYSTSGRSFGMQKDGADKAFGPGKFWSPKKESIAETATAGGTSAGNIGTIANPHHSPGKARGKKSYLGDPWGGISGTKAPPQPKVVQPKTKAGTAKNGLDIKGTSLFGGPANESTVIKRR
jgi:hypothetical protein